MLVLMCVGSIVSLHSFLLCATVSLISQSWAADCNSGEEFCLFGNMWPFSLQVFERGSIVHNAQHGAAFCTKHSMGIGLHSFSTQLAGTMVVYYYYLVQR